MNLSAPSRGLAALGLALAQGIALHAAAAVWYVDAANPSPQQDGASWATAFSTIQPAIDAAHADGGGEVWVAAGVYDEERTSVIDGIDTGSIVLADGVDMYGGFAGVESNRDDRDYRANPVVLDGSRSRNGMPAYHVVYANGDSVFDGFTVTGGNADHDTIFEGGGMLASGTAIYNCTFRNNRARFYGGGLSGSRLSKLADTIFEKNIAGSLGGAAVLSFDGDEPVERCIFRENHAEHGGGALLFAATSKGGTLDSCLFVDNSYIDTRSGGGGGAILVQGDAIIINSVFTGNSGATRGGAIYHRGSFDSQEGLLIGSTKLINCTFYGNDAPSGAVFYSFDIRLTFRNCIIWNHTGDWHDEHSSLSRSTLGVQNSVIEGGFVPDTVRYSAVNIIDADPLLVAPGLGNFRLRPGSPAIDAGLETDAPATEFDGAPRPVGDGVDIGAFEFDPKTFQDPYDTDGNGAVNALDVQRVVNQVLGMNACPFACDIDGDGLFDAVDVQFIINAAMGIR